RDGDLALRRVDRGQIADHRGREQHTEEGQVPVGVAIRPHRHQAGSGEGSELDSDDRLTRSARHGGAYRGSAPVPIPGLRFEFDGWRIELMNSSRSAVENRRWPPGVR